MGRWAGGQAMNHRCSMARASADLVKCVQGIQSFRPKQAWTVDNPLAIRIKKERSLEGVCKAGNLHHNTVCILNPCNRHRLCRYRATPRHGNCPRRATGPRIKFRVSYKNETPQRTSVFCALSSFQEKIMPVIAWLLGVPITVILLLMLFGVF